MAVDDEKPPVQSDSSGVPPCVIMGCSYVLVLHSMGHYDDSSTSLMMGSGQQYHTVCIRIGDALPMVK